MKKEALKVAIQGVAGCFHDAAAREFFADRDIETIEFDSFDDEFDALHSDRSLVGLAAIENTIAGSILTNHELLRKGGVRIVGEHRKRISHVLCALPGQTIDDITEINSHPMALMQCDEWLRQYPGIKKVERFDTAGSARDIAKDRLVGHAAICGEYAAGLYGLNILARGIETNKRNFTRFLVVANPQVADSISPGVRSIDKASLVFTLPHTKGALSKVLTILSFYDMNLSKIQSTPIIGREWEYRFYVDLTFDDPVRYRQSLEAIRPLITDLAVLGEYCESKTESL